MNYKYKKTKIVATIGPVSTVPEIFEQMLGKGLNVCRVNMSHADHQEQQDKIDFIKKMSAKSEWPLPILLDLCGPKIRIGNFENGKINLSVNDEILLVTEEIIGNETKVSINYPKIKEEVKAGSKIMLEDGTKSFEVINVSEAGVLCKVLIGGEIKDKRGVNLPGAYLSMSAITEKDKKDILFGIKNEVDFFALSFVRTQEDVQMLRQILDENNSKAKIISKIETEEALTNIDGIIKFSDGIMVARGDLAVEIGPEHVPVWQKKIIKKCNVLGKPVIVATQMLDSMIKSPVPTRAEVSDIANSIIDGADAIMLSQESAVGDFPVEAVNTMSKVAMEIENEFLKDKKLINYGSDQSITNAITQSVAYVAEDIGAKVIVAMTESGGTAKMIARHKSNLPIIVMSSYENILRQSSLSYGCFPVKIEKFENIVQALPTIQSILEAKGFTKGEKMVISAGVPFGVSGTTNTLLVESI